MSSVVGESRHLWAWCDYAAQRWCCHLVKNNGGGGKKEMRIWKYVCDDDTSRRKKIEFPERYECHLSVVFSMCIFSVASDIASPSFKLNTSWFISSDSIWSHRWAGLAAELKLNIFQSRHIVTRAWHTRKRWWVERSQLFIFLIFLWVYDTTRMNLTWRSEIGQEMGNLPNRFWLLVLVLIHKHFFLFMHVNTNNRNQNWLSIIALTTEKQTILAR